MMEALGLAVASPRRPTATATAAVALNSEQLAVVQAPLDQAVCVLAAAGTGKTTTMSQRVRWMLGQGVEAEDLLVLTFSRKAQAEFQQRLRRDVPGAEGATVSTFHGWSWLVLRSHWREAGFERRPTILSSEDQQLAIMQDCILWDRLGQLQASMRFWLFLPPSAHWPEVVEAAAERHSQLYAQCMRAALAAYNTDDWQQQPGSLQALAPEAAAALPFLQLPTRLQLLLLTELHAELCRRFDRQRFEGEGGGVQHLLDSAAVQAPHFLAWLEAEKRRGRLPDAVAYAALCAGAGLSRSPEVQERQKQLMRVAAAYQEELVRLGLATLADLPLLAQRALAAEGSRALEWARERWRYVLVDEFQDTGSTMLELLVLLMGERRSVTACGDDDQSIYSFLSAVPHIFTLFQQHFGARQLCLQTNFRSTPAICSFAGALLHGNRREADKTMVPARAGACAPVAVRQCASQEEEATALAAEVERLWRREGVPHSDVCVLFRCLRLHGGEPHGTLKAALRRRGIPFVVANQERLAEDPGVAALLSYLSLIANPACDPAFQAVLGLPYHGLGRDVCSAVAQRRQSAKLAGRPPPSLLDRAEQVCSQAAAAEMVGPGEGQQEQQRAAGGRQTAQLVGQLNADDLRELQRLVQLLKRMQASVGLEPLPQAVQRVLHESGLVAWLQQQQGEQQEEEEQGEQEQQQSGASPSSEAAAEGLPLPLRCVLLKAQQLAADWERQQQQQAAQTQQIQQPLAGQQVQTQQQLDTEQGVALVQELLSRLAAETAAVSLAEQIQEAQAAQQQQRGPGVLTISTIHVAKGLEWPRVLLPTVSEGFLPVQFRPAPALMADWQAAAAGQEEAQYWSCKRAHEEEERRLFHVAATRARDGLLVSYVLPPAPVPGAAPADCAPSDLPHCSSILASAARRLRQQPVVLHFEGRLPEEDFPGLRPQEEQEPAAPRGASCDGGVLAGGSKGNRQGGGGAQPAQLSVAEQCRLRLAAKAAGGSGSSGVGASSGVAKLTNRVRKPAAAALLRTGS